MVSVDVKPKVSTNNKQELERTSERRGWRGDRVGGEGLGKRWGTESERGIREGSERKACTARSKAKSIPRTNLGDSRGNGYGDADDP